MGLACYRKAQRTNIANRRGREGSVDPGGREGRLHAGKVGRDE